MEVKFRLLSFISVLAMLLSGQVFSQGSQARQLTLDNCENASDPGVQEVCRSQEGIGIGFDIGEDQLSNLEKLFNKGDIQFKEADGTVINGSYWVNRFKEIRYKILQLKHYTTASAGINLTSVKYNVIGPDLNDLKNIAKLRCYEQKTETCDSLNEITLLDIQDKIKNSEGCRRISFFDSKRCNALKELRDEMEAEREKLRFIVARNVKEVERGVLKLIFSETN